jgi:hypothetical protein
MIEQAGGPHWRLLYAVIAVMVGLLVLDARASLLPAGHEILEVGIVLVGFGLIELWIRANRRALAGGRRGTGMRQPAPGTEWYAATGQGVLFIEEGPHHTPIRHARDGDEVGLPEQTTSSLN